MTRYYILKDREPVPIDDARAWSKFFQEEHRRVAYDEVGDVRISTVFLGLDHSWTGPPPLLFETMIFGGEHDEYQERCSTWAEAEAQHAEALALVSSPSPSSPQQKDAS